MRKTYSKNANNYNRKCKEITDRLNLKPFTLTVPLLDDSSTNYDDPIANNNNNNNIPVINDDSKDEDSEINNENNSLDSQSLPEDQALLPAGEEEQWLVPMEGEEGSYWDKFFQLSLWINALVRYNSSVDLYQVTANLALNVNLGISYTVPFSIPPMRESTRARGTC